MDFERLFAARLGEKIRIVKYDRYANNCYYDNLVLISPTAFEAIRREGVSRADLQKTLYDLDFSWDLAGS